MTDDKVDIPCGKYECKHGCDCDDVKAALEFADSLERMESKTECDLHTITLAKALKPHLTPADEEADAINMLVDKGYQITPPHLTAPSKPVGTREALEWFNAYVAGLMLSQDEDIKKTIRATLTRPKVDAEALRELMYTQLDIAFASVISSDEYLPIDDTQQGAEWMLELVLSQNLLQAQGVDWQPTLVEEPDGLHHNPSAKAWAEYFVAVYPQHKHMEDVMLGWFANAMMAIYDSQSDQSAVVDWP